MTRYDVARLTTEPLLNAGRAENIISGFRKTGIYPLDTSSVINRIKNQELNVKKRKRSSSSSLPDSYIDVDTFSILSQQREQNLEREHKAMKLFIEQHGLIDEFKQHLSIDILHQLTSETNHPHRRKNRMIKADSRLLLTEPEMIARWELQQEHAAEKSGNTNKRRKRNHNDNNKENQQPNTSNNNGNKYGSKNPSASSATPALSISAVSSESSSTSISSTHHSIPIPSLSLSSSSSSILDQFYVYIE
jgi:hypothetical protein